VRCDSSSKIADNKARSASMLAGKFLLKKASDAPERRCIKDSLFCSDIKKPAILR
jgi:hypothetical protein